MPICENCWGDAFIRAYSSRRSQGECYREILEERKGHTCTREQQRGQWSEEEYQEMEGKSFIPQEEKQ